MQFIWWSSPNLCFLRHLTLFNFIMMTECKKSNIHPQTHIQCIPHTCTLIDPLFLKFHASSLSESYRLLSCVSSSLVILKCEYHQQNTYMFHKGEDEYRNFFTQVFYSFILLPGRYFPSMTFCYNNNYYILSCTLPYLYF